MPPPVTRGLGSPDYTPLGNLSFNPIYPNCMAFIISLSWVLNFPISKMGRLLPRFFQCLRQAVKANEILAEARLKLSRRYPKE